MTQIEEPIKHELTVHIAEQATPSISASQSTAMEKIASLKEMGAERFDPIHFCFIESMARKSLGQKESVCLLLEEKIQTALVEYQDAFSQAREDAENSIARIVFQRPDCEERLSQFYEKCDFNAVKNFESRLARTRPRSSLAELTRQVSQGADSINANRENHTFNFQNGLTPDSQKGSLVEIQKTHSFSEILQQQEDNIVRSIADSATYSDSGSAWRVEKQKQTELKSTRLFRESWVKRSADKVVTRAVKEGPENPGPLNSQSLAIRSLTIMRDLSPEYLSRYVSYIETLLWLERADQGDEPVKAKRSGGKAKPKSKSKSKPKKTV